MSVLITAASHAEAYKLERLLQLPDIIFADHQELPHLAFSGKHFIRIPKGNSASYAHEMLDIALNQGIERIFPLHPEELLPLAESRQLLSEYGISVVVPSVLWLKEHVANSENPPLQPVAIEPVIIELGNVIAGKLPEGIYLPEENFTGIFYFESEIDKINFKLFTA